MLSESRPPASPPPCGEGSGVGGGTVGLAGEESSAVGAAALRSERGAPTLRPPSQPFPARGQGIAPPLSPPPCGEGSGVGGGTVGLAGEESSAVGAATLRSERGARTLRPPSLPSPARGEG